jgi:hypothetical protein
MDPTAIPARTRGKKSMSRDTVALGEGDGCIMLTTRDCPVSVGSLPSKPAQHVESRSSERTYDKHAMFSHCCCDRHFARSFRRV